MSDTDERSTEDKPRRRRPATEAPSDGPARERTRRLVPAADLAALRGQPEPESTQQVSRGMPLGTFLQLGDLKHSRGFQKWLGRRASARMSRESWQALYGEFASKPA